MSTIKAQIQKQLKQRPLEILVLILGVVYLIIDIYLFKKNPNHIINVNIIVNPIMAVIVTLLAFLLTRKMGPGNPRRPLWSGLTIGWGLWTIAEILYALPLLAGQKATYPSIADIFWVLGYIPMFYAFLQRQRVLPVELSRNNKILSLVIILIVIGFTGYFILFPILGAFNPDEAVVSILNLVYPLLDLTLLLLVLRLFFAFVQGTYGQAHLWVAIGFFMKTFSDLFYYYLNGIARYYHYGLVDFRSVFLVDFTHTASYLLFLVGLIVLSKVPGLSASTPNPSDRIVVN
jgi:hypothetical protein